MNIKLTVFFEEPFWVGVFERTEGIALQTARVVFGAEPKDYEIYDVIINKYYFLSYSQAVKIETKNEQRINPKRLKRIISKELSNKGIGTKAQIAVKAQYEAKKLDIKKKNKEKREVVEQIKYEKRQQKKKEKKKGH